VAIFGMVISAIASESSWVWMIIGTLVGSLAGLLIGKHIDHAAEKK
jgi:hypothetical protein